MVLFYTTRQCLFLGAWVLRWVIFPLLSAGLNPACYRHDPPVSVLVCTFEEMSTARDYALSNTFNAEIKFLMRIFWVDFGGRKDGAGEFTR